MLLNRMSLRSTAAIGAATLVAGATFAVSAFADEGVDPEVAASAALPDEEAPAEEAVEDDFFSSSEQPTEEELQAARDEARAERDAAVGARTQTTASEAQDIEEEPEEPETPVFTGDAQGLALDMVLAEGWPESEFTDCLQPLWQKESNWNHLAENPSSGAYGIPQALPGSKMASHGSDWQTNPATQIAWGIDYIKGRYGTPCGAWAHSQSVGWY
ncbi:lytic transglycosylase domain-containing protein [Nocardiopsis sp. NPDC057823]|uniref:aggregation-promoting factor C-terminal-like domain-containing protein n=2 Tax=unclassified Nocardiopsis TaxID=2649073 RepID=UPI00366B05C7